MTLLSKIVSDLDTSLRHSEIKDFPGAYNGLQLENNGRVTKIGAAVDSHEKVLLEAIRQNVDLLIVHHGLWWKDPRPLTGPAYRKISKALEANLAVYSSHLPLDLHPKLGNNALLAKRLGFKKTTPFLQDFGQSIGLSTKLRIDRNVLAQKVEKEVGFPVRLIPGGPKITAHVGLVTGGAGNEIAQAQKAGMDTFITGEGSHWTYGTAMEMGINLIYAGHYATETFGVQAVARHLSQKYKVPWVWIDHPSGL
jgi:dinuclear metal center YbgI/SA1388 family protein